MLGRKLLTCLAGATLVGMVGCTSRTTIIPNADAELNKSVDRFVAEASACFPYPADAPAGGELAGRVNVGYVYNQLSLINYSDEAWTYPQIWVNRSYVLPLESIGVRDLKRINFKMLYNEAGQHFPLNNREVKVESVEILIDRKLYTIPFETAR